jgi:hypothetical protein
MSEVMLDDKNTMDDINPFVNFMPGTSRQPYEFGKYAAPMDEPDEEIYKSPACGVISKNIGRLGYRSEECSLSRPLIPGRTIDRGFTNYNIKGDKEIEKKATEAAMMTKNAMNISSVLCLILLIAMF